MNVCSLFPLPLFTFFPPKGMGSIYHPPRLCQHGNTSHQVLIFTYSGVMTFSVYFYSRSTAFAITFLLSISKKPFIIFSCTFSVVFAHTDNGAYIHFFELIIVNQLTFVIVDAKWNISSFTSAPLGLIVMWKSCTCLPSNAILTSFSGVIFPLALWKGSLQKSALFAVHTHTLLQSVDTAVLQTPYLVIIFLEMVPMVIFHFLRTCQFHM